MASNRIRLPLTVAAVAVLLAVALSSSGVVTRSVSTVIDDAARLAAGLSAAAACLWTAPHRRGVERGWRTLVGAGMAGWSIGQATWSWYRTFADTPPPSPSLADIGYFTLPVFAFAALLVLAKDRTPGGIRDPGPRSRPVLVLDGLVVVGALFIVTWCTALGAVVRAGASNALAFVVAVGYPLTDWILVAMVVLLLATYRVVYRRPTQLVLLGLGLVGISVSDSIFAYVVAVGAAEMPAILNAGFVAGPALIAVAALAGTEDGDRRTPAHARRMGAWAHRLAPYPPVVAACLVVLVRTARGHGPDPFAVYLGLLVGGLVMVRQIITLVENSVLLGRLVEAQDGLSYLAFHDQLTGLANRALFRDRVAAAVDESAATGLLFVDLDDFKVVNDSLGHAAGDVVLRAVAGRLRTCVGEAGTVARLGGDEFGVLLPGDVELVRDLGSRILLALRRPFDVNGRAITIGASVGGVISGPADRLTADTLLRRADAAMYTGKRRGKGGLVVYEPGTAAALGDPDLPKLLAVALKAGELEVQYQPIIALDNGAVVAVEALARWRHPVLGDVAPDVFVAAAERAGLIDTLDNLVLRHACREVAALAAHGTVVDLHVNVCARRLCDPELEAAVRAALLDHDFPGSRLVLEITETSWIPDLVRAAEAIGRLRGLGVRLAIDDFGTGYNTLAQLHLLPVDIVKLCQAHTALDGDGDGARLAALCGAVVSICRSLGLAVVAEGVETPTQAGALARLGCQLGQGYLYGRSAPLLALKVPLSTPAG
jgi:diguanylate cyclase (GGDEF)-like protein